MTAELVPSIMHGSAVNVLGIFHKLAHKISLRSSAYHELIHYEHSIFTCSSKFHHGNSTAGISVATDLPFN